MIYELRTYTLQPGKQGEYLKYNSDIGRPIRGDKFGPGFPARPIEAEVGDLMLVCDGDNGQHDNTEPYGWRGSPDDPSMRVPVKLRSLNS